MSIARNGIIKKKLERLNRFEVEVNQLGEISFIRKYKFKCTCYINTCTPFIYLIFKHHLKMAVAQCSVSDQGTSFCKPYSQPHTQKRNHFFQLVIFVIKMSFCRRSWTKYSNS